MTAIIAMRLDSRSRNWPYAITLTFTADRYVHTFDPPYRGETSAITGRYAPGDGAGTRESGRGTGASCTPNIGAA